MNLENKSQMKSIIGIIILLASLALIGSMLKNFISESESTQAETICRASVAAKAKYSTSFAGKDLSPPLLCKTHLKKIKSFGGTLEEEKEFVMKSLSDLAARCWWTFGNGLVDEIFPGGFFQDKKCFICYSAKIKPGSYFKGEESITTADLSKYLFNKPYSSRSITESCYLGGGICIENNLECGEGFAQNHPFYSALGNCPPDMLGEPKKCCYNPDPCLNKGGKCMTKEDYESEYLEGYKCDPTDKIIDVGGETINQVSCEPISWFPAIQNDLWSCKNPVETCYVPAEAHISYIDYIQEEGGPGKLFLESDIEPGEVYGVAFTEKTKTDNTLWEAFMVGGAVIGVTAAIIFSGGTALIVVAGVAGAATGYVGSIEVTEIKSFFDSEEYDAIHLVKLSDVFGDSNENKICKIVEDINK